MRTETLERIRSFLGAELVLLALAPGGMWIFGPWDPDVYYVETAIVFAIGIALGISLNRPLWTRTAALWGQTLGLALVAVAVAVGPRTIPRIASYLVMASVMVGGLRVAARAWHPGRVRDREPVDLGESAADLIRRERRESGRV